MSLSSIRRAAAAAAALGLLWSAPVSAQPSTTPDAPPSATAADRDALQFFDFESVLLRGELRRPKVLLFTHRERARFERLLELNRPVLPRLAETAKDVALR